MDTKVTAILTNEDGWQRQVPLQEGIHWLGSAREAQIFLNHADQVAPYHLQIVNHDTEDCLRLINLSGKEIPVDIDAQKTVIPANGIKDVYGPEVLFIGPYTLQFEINKKYIQRQVTREQQSRFIGLRLVLSGQVLKPDCPITGTLYLQNSGNTACQFEVELEGLPRDCYEITPPPLIYAGGEETAEIHFYHRGTTPPAGQQTFTLSVSAPTAYPGRVVSIEQTLKVMACYDHTFAFEEPEVKTSRPAREAKAPVIVAPEATTPAEKSPEGSLPEAKAPEISATPAPVSAPVSSQPETPLAQPSVSAPISAPEPVASPVVELAPLAPDEPLPGSEEEQSAVQILPSRPKTSPKPIRVEAEPLAGASAAEPAAVEPETAQPDPTDTVLPSKAPQKSKRPDLSGVKVIRASNGDFLGKRDDLS